MTTKRSSELFFPSDVVKRIVIEVIERVVVVGMIVAVVTISPIVSRSNH